MFVYCTYCTIFFCLFMIELETFSNSMHKAMIVRLSIFSCVISHDGPDSHIIQ